MGQRFRGRFATGWIGFQGKTLWDWIQLLIVPALLSGGALFFNDRNAKTQLELASDSQQETALQDYIDDMSTLLLDADLRGSQTGSEPRTVARTRTLSVLRAVDADRARTVLQFLQETQLISITAPVIVMNLANLPEVDLFRTDLSYTDLGGVRLTDAVLTEADLIGTNLARADLTTARMSGADFSGANLAGAILANTTLTNANFTGANLTGANLAGANLAGAVLTNAQLTDEQLAQAKSLTGATLPDGTTSE